MASKTREKADIMLMRAACGNDAGAIRLAAIDFVVACIGDGVLKSRVLNAGNMTVGEILAEVRREETPIGGES